MILSLNSTACSGRKPRPRASEPSGSGSGSDWNISGGARGEGLRTARGYAPRYEGSRPSPLLWRGDLAQQRGNTVRNFFHEHRLFPDKP